MDTTFTEEQEMLRKATADFLAKEVSESKVREIEESETGLDLELWKGMAGLGWMGLVIPEEYDGMGMTFQDLSIILEEMGKNIAPGPFFCTVLEGAYPILDAGTEEQKKEFLPGIANGDLIFTMALLEADGIYEASGVATKAIPKDDSFIINGTKLFVEQANNAHYLICVTRTREGASPEDGITVFIVDAKTPGIRVEVMPTIGMDKLCQVDFKDVAVPKRNMLGEPDKGWLIVKKILERAAIAKTSESVGAMEAIVPMTADYLKQRVQYDQPLAQFQALQHIVADMFITMTAGRYLVYEATWMESEGLSCSKEVAMAKSYVNQAYKELSRLMIRLYGGNGTNREFKPGLYYRRARASDVAFGSTDFHRELVANQIGLLD
jgi:alkylation response protein AidB-like acyl-CoA dehydrogenase